MKTTRVKRYRYKQERINTVLAALGLLGVGILSVGIDGDITACVFLVPMALILLFDRKES